MLWRECALVGTMLHRTLDSDSHSDSRTPTCGALTAVSRPFVRVCGCMLAGRAQKQSSLVAVGPSTLQKNDALTATPN